MPEVIDESVPHEQIRRPLADEKGVQPMEMNEAVVEGRSFNLVALVIGAVVVVAIVLGVFWLVSGSGG